MLTPAQKEEIGNFEFELGQFVMKFVGIRQYISEAVFMDTEYNSADVSTYIDAYEMYRSSKVKLIDSCNNLLIFLQS